jgi:dTDP-4-dehydrorhamnose 3,5-epimerase
VEGNAVHFKDGPIQGVIVRNLAKHADGRGWLTELFRSDEIDEQLLPVMSYVSSSEPGVVRGPHEHQEQADFFCFIGPSNFRIIMWDNRRESATYGNKIVLEAGEDQPRSIIVPARVVHAYKNIGSKPGWSLNFPNRLYAGKMRREPVDEVRHESDPNTPFRMD